MRLPWGLRWWELLPEAVLGLGLALFLATETDAATSAFESSTAIALMAVVTLAWIAARVALVRWTDRPGVRVALFGVAALAVLRIVVLPAYDDTTVVEELPVVAAEPDGSSEPAPTTTTAPGSDGVPAPDPVPTTTTTRPAAPVELRRAQLHGIDHRASGTAVVYRQPDGTLTVGLEGIDIQPGPDYDVFVVPGGDREDVDGGIRLDDLRGNQGTQYYAVPEGTDLTDGPWTVLVWCQTFDVPVAGATPA